MVVSYHVGSQQEHPMLNCQAISTASTLICETGLSVDLKLVAYDKPGPPGTPRIHCLRAQLLAFPWVLGIQTQSPCMHSKRKPLSYLACPLCILFKNHLGHSSILLCLSEDAARGE